MQKTQKIPATPPEACQSGQSAAGSAPLTLEGWQAENNCYLFDSETDMSRSEFERKFYPLDWGSEWQTVFVCIGRRFVPGTAEGRLEVFMGSRYGVGFCRHHPLPEKQRVKILEGLGVPREKWFFSLPERVVEITSATVFAEAKNPSPTLAVVPRLMFESEARGYLQKLLAECKEKGLL